MSRATNSSALSLMGRWSSSKSALSAKSTSPAAVATIAIVGLAATVLSRSVMGILGADGAFAEFVSVPVTNLHVVSESVSDEEAVFTEPLAAAFEILEQVQLNPGDEVLVLGDGKLGIFARRF